MARYSELRRCLHGYSKQTPGPAVLVMLRRVVLLCSALLRQLCTAIVPAHLPFTPPIWFTLLVIEHQSALILQPHRSCPAGRPGPKLPEHHATNQSMASSLDFSGAYKKDQIIDFTF